MSGLRDLDARVVPRAAARLRAAVDRAGARRRAVREGARAVVAPSGPLGRLDDRFARRGPLRLVRDVPQVGLGVALAVLLAGAGVALARNGDGPSSPGTTRAAPEVRVLGPAVGAEVEDYLVTSRARAAALSQAQPEAEHVALVSLGEYRTPDDVADLLVGVEVERAFLRVPSDTPGEVLTSDVEDLVGDLRALYAATAERKAEDQREFVRLARSLGAATEEQRQVRDFYELSAQIAGREATAYRTGCACVFAAVVRGTADALAELPALTGVRGVELAPRGVALEELRVQPLDPRQTGRVEAGAVPRPQPSPAATGG